MSHFTVLIIGDNIEEQLAPFDENMEVPRYVEYTKQELIEKGKQEIENCKNDDYAKYLADPAEFKNKSTEWYFNYISKEFPKRLKWTDEEIYLDQINSYEKENIGENGEIYSTYNPQSKWDWWEIGGRWTGSLPIKKGSPYEAPEFSFFWKEEEKRKVIDQRGADTALLKDIDREAMRENLVKYQTEIYEDVKNEKFCFVEKSEKEFIKNHSIDEYLEKYLPHDFNFYAILKDGIWYQKGEMKMFGMSINNIPLQEWKAKTEEIISNLDPETRLTVVDCHI